MAPRIHPTCAESLADLTLDDIRRLPVLAFPDGQAEFYRFGDSHVIKVSSRPMLRRQFRTARLAYDLLGLPQIPHMSDERIFEENGSDVYCLLMDLKPGIRLEDAWPVWDCRQKQQFWVRFLDVCAAMARHTSSHISSIGHGPVRDELFDTTYEFSKDQPGPFATEPEFIAAISWALARRAFHDHRVPFACRLLETMAIHPKQARDEAFTLTHGNLQGGHILVSDPSQTSHVEITGILGWEQCGYYPGWWEISKIMLDNAAGAHSEPSALADGLTNYGWLKDWRGYAAEVSTMMHVWNYIF